MVPFRTMPWITGETMVLLQRSFLLDSPPMETPLPWKTLPTMELEPQSLELEHQENTLRKLGNWLILRYHDPLEYFYWDVCIIFTRYRLFMPNTRRVFSHSTFALFGLIFFFFFFAWVDLYLPARGCNWGVEHATRCALCLSGKPVGWLWQCQELPDQGKRYSV